jgi:hypothetical protein
MGRIRGWVKRLEHAARGDVASFELLDGSRYYFDPAGSELFLHWIECGTAGNPDKWPEPPERVRKVCEAKDPEKALESIMGEGSWDMLPYNAEVLITERRLEPVSLVAGRDVWDQEVEDLSE